jgi:hypothetical protein
VCVPHYAAETLRRFHSDGSIAPSATAEQSAHNNTSSGNSGEARPEVSSSATTKRACQWVP